MHGFEQPATHAGVKRQATVRPRTRPEPAAVRARVPAAGAYVKMDLVVAGFAMAAALLMSFLR